MVDNCPERMDAADAEAAAVDICPDRDGGGVLIGDEGGVHVGGVGREDSDSGQDSVSLETVDSNSGGGYLS